MDERRVTVEPASAPAYEVRVGAGVATSFAADCARTIGHTPGRLFAALDDGPSQAHRKSR